MLNIVAQIATRGHAMRELGQSRLKYFAAVCRHGSIRGAADSLNTAPSVITRQIVLLEKELGLKLFERQARGMKLNDAAAHVLEYWRSCQAHRQQLSERLEAIERLDEGYVRIVLSEGYVDHLVEHIVGPFCAQHPKLSIAIDALPVSDIMNQVGDDTAHIGLAYNPQADPRIHFVASMPAPARLLVCVDHPLTRHRRPVIVNQFSEFPFASMPAGYGVSQLVEALEYSEHVKFRPTFISSSIVALRRYVRTTQGVAIIGAGVAAASEMARGELVMLDIDHAICAKAKLRLITRRARPLSPAASRLLANIRNRLASFGMSTRS
jgi:DNA-binding transcriptional LysR family regulator